MYRGRETRKGRYTKGEGERRLDTQRERNDRRIDTQMHKWRGTREVERQARKGGEKVSLGLVNMKSIDEFSY